MYHRLTTSAAALIAILVALCVITLVSHALHAPLDFDEGYNMQVPLNLAESTTYATYDLVHDPKITSGWPLLAPASLLINTADPSTAPRYITLLYSALLLAVVGIFVQQTSAQRIVFLAGTFFVPLFYLFSTSLLGEIPALTLTVTSLVAWQRKQYVASGILLGLAVATKQTYALAAIAMLGEAGINYRSYPRQTTIRMWISFGCAFLSIHALWALYQMSSVGSLADYQQLLRAAGDWARSQATPRPDLIQSKLQMIQQILHIDSTVLVGISGVFAYVSFQARAAYVIRVLSLLALVWIMYILMLGATAWYRHLFPALVMLLVVASHHVRYMSRIPLNKKHIFLLVLPVTIAVQSLIFHNPLDHFAYLTRAQNLLFLDHSNRPYRQPKQVLRHQRQAASFINTIPHTQVIAGLGWYNAPQVSYLAKRHILRDPTHADFVIVDIYARYLNEGGVEEFMKKHPFITAVFENPSYTIYEMRPSSCRKI